jgi:hypothetical protein
MVEFNEVIKILSTDNKVIMIGLIANVITMLLKKSDYVWQLLPSGYRKYYPVLIAFLTAVFMASQTPNITIEQFIILSIFNGGLAGIQSIGTYHLISSEPKNNTMKPKKEEPKEPKKEEPEDQKPEEIKKEIRYISTPISFILLSIFLSSCMMFDRKDPCNPSNIQIIQTALTAKIVLTDGCDTSKEDCKKKLENVDKIAEILTLICEVKNDK